MAYAAIAIGLAFGATPGNDGNEHGALRQLPWLRSGPYWVLVYSGTHLLPTAAATKALLLSYDQLQQNGGHYRVGGPSEFVLRLAYYRGLPTMSIRSWMSTTIL